MATKFISFPAQKKSFSEKTEKWGIQNIEAGISISNSDISKVRKTKAEMQVNYNLGLGIIDESDIEKAFNPMGIKGVNFPAKIQNYPIEQPKINILKGEEGRRRFDWKIRSVNEDVISQKEFIMQEQLYSTLVEEIQNENYSEEMVAKRLRQLEHYHQYDYQDSSEVMGTRIMDYFWHTQKLKNLFSDSFYDVLYAGEEVFACDIVHGEPQLIKRHPLNITTFGSGDSYKIEDSDIIVDDGYYPVGKVIDMFWDVLTPDEVDMLEAGGKSNRYHGNNIVLAGPMDIERELQDYSTSQLITVDGRGVNTYGGYFDTEGNVRVTRVVWKSRRKIGKLTYFDPEGNEQMTIIDERFPVEQYKHLGWKAEWYWINEWWQGYKIAHDLYKRVEALPRIGSRMSNPSICLPPYVGTIYSIGTGPAVSLMDRIKPYKYLYNIYMRRTELASARNKGVIAELDLAEIPDGWDEELVMMFAEANGYMIKDSFSEGKKGIAQGKLISTIKQRGSDVLNLNSADVIRANLELARYVKNELGEIAGISPQREGQIDNRETFGGIERAVTQSSHITEEWFRVHDNTKIRAMELLMETAKYAWRNYEGDNLKKLQYVDDGLITHIFNIDGREFAESEYGYFISNNQSDAELIQVVKTLAQAGLQNDKIKFSDLFTIYRDTSISSMIRKVERSEARAEERQDEQMQQQLESQERVQDAINQIEMMKLEQEWRIEESRIEADLTAKEMEFEKFLLGLESKAGIDAEESEKNRAHDIEKLKMQIEQRRKELKDKREMHTEKLKAAKDALDQKIKSSEKVARSRKSARASA